MDEISKLVINYTPNPDGVDLLQQTKMVLLAGITGSGKNTILDEMMKTGRFYDLITTISRYPRVNNGVLEQDGVDYYFVSEAGSHELLRANQYIEVSLVHGRLYGVTLPEIERAHRSQKIIIADIDVQGVAKYMHLSDSVKPIFVVPPSYDEWKNRIKQRYKSEASFLEDWPNRRNSALKELRAALKNKYYAFVVNDDLGTAADECTEIANNTNITTKKQDIARDLVSKLIYDIESDM